MFYTNSEDEIKDTITYFKIVILLFLIICIGKIENKKNEIKQFRMKSKIRNINIYNDGSNDDKDGNYDTNNDYINANNLNYYDKNYIYNNDMFLKKITMEDIKEKKEKEKQEYKHFLDLKNKPKDKNDPLIKKDILRTFSNNLGEKISSKSNIIIFMDTNCSFGNHILILNKLIFYCEIIGCKKIILEKNNNLYIRNNIYDKKYNIKIEVSDKDIERTLYNDDDNDADIGEAKLNEGFEDDDNDNDNDNINAHKIAYNGNNYYSNKSNDKNQKIYYLNQLDNYFYFNNYNIRTENKFHIFKNEILRNLPNIKTNKEDLYIHIRGSDIFKNKNAEYAPDYAQPPLCFYQKIFKLFKFRKIYIISADEENPVIKQLINENKNIIFKANSIEIDIATLAYAYNIVGSISSFLISIIKLNNNLKQFWEYDRYPVILGVPHLHHSLYNFTRKYTIFNMKPSKIYKNQMIIWQRSEEQIKIMLNDTCPYDFTVIKPNI